MVLVSYFAGVFWEWRVDEKKIDLVERYPSRIGVVIRNCNSTIIIIISSGNENEEQNEISILLIYEYDFLVDA